MLHVSCLKPAQDPRQLIDSGKGCALNPHGLKKTKAKSIKTEKLSDKSVPLVNTLISYLALKPEILTDACCTISFILI